MNSHQKQKGFTLLEIMLVLVIMSSVIFMMIGYVQQRTLQTQIDRSVMQVQQILNAGLAYYVDHGEWPANLACLQGAGAAPDCNTSYLPGTIYNPFDAGGVYAVKQVGGQFIVYARINRGQPNSYNVASIIVNKLPLGYTSTTSANTTACNVASTTCYVNASVTVPAESLINAGSINFAGVYHHGGCVPVPTCPMSPDGTAMTPQVIVVPVSMGGYNDPNSLDAYPIVSFTAYYTGGTNDTPDPCSTYSGASTSCGAVAGSTPSSNKYWRACADITTERGNVAETNSGTGVNPYPDGQWGGSVLLMAVTRCVIDNEATGSDWTTQFFTR